MALPVGVSIPYKRVTNMDTFNDRGVWWQVSIPYKRVTNVYPLDSKQVEIWSFNPL